MIELRYKIIKKEKEQKKGEWKKSMRKDVYQLTTVSPTKDALEVNTILIPAPGSSDRIFMTKLTALSLIAAAQVTTLTDDGRIVWIFPATWAVGSYVNLDFGNGFPLTLGFGLNATSPVAGPQILFHIEHYIQRASYQL